LKDAGI